jgi:S-adenosylhomocysteine hydrolase
VRLKDTVHDIPPEQDQNIARVKLETQRLKIDTLTGEQLAYMEDYSAGT